MDLRGRSLAITLFLLGCGGGGTDGHGPSLGDADADGDSDSDTGSDADSGADADADADGGHEGCISDDECAEGELCIYGSNHAGTCESAGDDCEITGCELGLVCRESVPGAFQCERECSTSDDCEGGRDCLTLADGIPFCGAMIPDISCDGGCNDVEQCYDFDGDGDNECHLTGECLYDGHCARGDRCYDTDGDGLTECAPPSDRCEDDAGCWGSAACVDVDGDGFNECQERAGVCTYDSDCPGDRVCGDPDYDGATDCYDPGDCQSTMDCVAGEFCALFGTTGKGTCTELGGDPCRHPSDCRPNQTCLDLDGNDSLECVPVD